MASAKTYLVPADFSKTSEVALTHAIRLAREAKGKIFLLHVISNSALMLPGSEVGSGEMILELRKALEENARKEMQKLVQRKRLRPREYRSLIVVGGDPATVIASQAKKSRASVIVMGSHGRTGLKRLMLGSVAERTLRYAECPVLIVKR